MVPSIAIYNNLGKHLSFVYKESNDQTILFQTIQSSIIHLFAHSLNVKQFYLTQREDPARMDLGVIAMKGYFTFSRAPALLEPHYQIV